MSHPIPSAALDDRLGFLGTSGSGKTYNAGVAVERLLHKRARVVIVDPLGVWWGLRLMADGKKPSPYNVAIFGGPRGDLPLTEHAGALIGETAATMAESCIIDLRELGSKSAERRFMTAFLDKIYRAASGEPFHLIVDEADLFAPQKPAGGDETLLGHMENIVRRGRVKGFIPWLISQRPAVLNKNVLSQVDGLIAFKLTSSQDRDALDSWIEGQADKAQGRAIKDALPAMEIGQGVVWLPGRGVLTTAKFPQKETFDSSRTPKRGEKVKRTAALRPLDLGALKGQLATIEAEAKANDPKKLRAELAQLQAARDKLEKSIAAAAAAKPAADPEAIEKAEQRGFEQARKKLENASNRALIKAKREALSTVALELTKFANIVGEAIKNFDVDDRLLAIEFALPAPAQPLARSAPTTAAPRPVPRALPRMPSPANPAAPIGDGTITASLQKVIDAIAWWRKIGVEPVARARAAVVAGYSPKASTFGVYVAELVKMGMVATGQGVVALTPEGLAIANIPRAGTAAELRDMARSLLEPQPGRVFDVVYEAYPEEIRRDAIAEAVGLSPTASTVGVYIAQVAAYGIIENAGRGAVRAADWLFPAAERAAA